MKEQESIVQKLHKAFAKQTGVSLLASFEVLSTIKKNGNFDGINGFSERTDIIKFHDTQKIKLYDFVEYLVGRVFFIIVFCSPAYFIAEILYTNSNRDGLFVFFTRFPKGADRSKFIIKMEFHFFINLMIFMKISFNCGLNF